VANPVFNNAKQFHVNESTRPVGFDLEQQPGMGAPQGPDVMTYDGVLIKAASFFMLAIASAVLVGLYAYQFVFPIAIAAFVMSLVVVFTTRKEPKPGLFAVTIALYGGAAGGISRLYENEWSGIILQALIATAVVFAVSLAVYKSGRVRNMPKIRKFLSIAIPAYVVFSLINVAMVWTGGPDIREMNIPGTGIPLGLILSLVAIAIGAFMLISDFDFVDNGVRNQLPSKWEWTASYGLVFSIIWIYIEMLRLLSYLRR
jgi:uncharacterized YccA/Bax inhibitor family protein